MQFLVILATVLLAGFVGFALATAIGVATPKADGGDWLNAGATAAGVMLTVLTAVSIEYYRRTWRMRSDRARLKEALTELTGATDDASNIEEWSDEPGTRKKSLALQSRLLSAIRKYHFVRSKVEVTDLTLWEMLEELDSLIESDEPMLTREMSMLRDVGEHAQVYAINRENVMGATARFKPQLAKAVEAAR